MKIQKTRIRGKRGGYEQRSRKMITDFKRTRGICHSNLVNINLSKDRYTKCNVKNLSCGLVNVRSVKNKDIWLKQLLSEEIDICILTETWLNENDMEWIESCELNKDGFRMSNSFRNDGRRVGGIALVYRDMFSIKQINEKHLNTYHSVK